MNVEKVLKAMISYREPWVPLLSTVHPKSMLLQHPTVSVALKALRCLTNEQQRQGLRVEFLETLKDDEISLLATYCVLVSSQKSTINGNEEEEWKALLLSERRRVQIFCESFVKVEQAFHFLQYVCEGYVVISDADSIINEINNRKRVKVHATLKDALDVGYWGTLKELIGSSETATKARGSIIYANVAHLCLKENLASSQTVVGELTGSSDIPQNEASKILHLLEKEGLYQFKEACSSFTDFEKDPKIADVDVLLSGIDNEEALSRELREISSICDTLVPQKKKEMLKKYLSFPFVCAKVQQLMSIYAALGFEDSKDEAVTKDLEDFLQVSSSLRSDLTLRRVSEIVGKKSVAMVNSELDDMMKTIMETLQMSSELILFMKETANEDIRILIDAVEERSDQFVSEAIVSDLIDVHGFLRNILQETPKDPMMFLASLKECYRTLEKKSEMAAKIKECGYNVHSLRGLYMNVANRGEMTKEIINNAVQKGCYIIKTNSDGSSDVQLSYRRNESAAKETTYDMTELHDLRSRALLILNTDKRQEQVDNSEDSSASDQSANHTLPTFITQVEMITEIVNIVTSLRESGHPKYRSFWQKLKSSQEIESQALTLERTLQDWETLLKRLQEQYFFLNFFHPDQLWLLHKFFSKRLANVQGQLSLIPSVHSLLRFVDPNIQRKELDDFRSLYNAPKGDSGLEINLRAIGEVLDSIFIQRQGMQLKKIPQHDLQRAIKPGELFVAVLEHGSKQTANVVMSLFESTTGSFPQPSQVLFCHSETSWGEVKRLLKRSFEAHTHSTSVKLHCLANVENLSNDLQFELVTAIRTHQKKVEGPYLLALVCCGGIHHHIADQFSNAAHNILGMSEPKLRDTFKDIFPNVFMVTSDLPGVGKTEAIHEHAASCKKKALTVPISGPLSRKNLLRRLSTLNVSPNECIHFDVGEVDDPLVLDTMMFELVVVGMMSCGTELFHLPTKHVYIEIANTLRHWLQDSLPITKCFSPIHIKLVGYGDLVVSPEPLSPVQVVCQYLHAYESGSLETKDLNLVDLKPLSPDRCKQLLSKHFSSTGDLSYNIVESFLKVFADQLLQFSESPFFKTHNLQAALGLQHDVRNYLFKALLEVSREFASRSVVTCKDVQSEAISKEQASEVLKKLHSCSRNDAEGMVERVEGMIQWADNNHLVIAFHRLEAFTISALYRDLSQVPSNVQKLLKVQAKKGEDIKDFAKLNHRELQERLDLIVRKKPRQNDDGLQKLDYALTPDNILKMVLIIQRIKARIPVIVMGETGCGKTSLVRYLARTCGVPFYVFNFHAGVTEEEVTDFIDQRETEAKTGKEVWVFLDEINTCEYLGTINEMICHRSIKGKPITTNLVFIAACNPYRLRPPEKITTAGLSEKIEKDQFSKLVYRVHPLPETMIDFVWDYGPLGKDDEHTYIGRMVEGITGKPDNLLADLLCTSQQYIREIDGSSYCVSLRDAHRCIVLVNWFGDALKERNDLPLTKSKGNSACHSIAPGFPNSERSFVLALAHCYQSRLSTAEARKGYQQRVAECFRKHKKNSFQEQSFEAIVRAEQEDYLERMELPEGTAKNGALRENVFVMLVCILNRIPVFVVGKPGCSKSLSMQIIRSNLRGKDAKDPFLKKFPQLYVVSHQGSESSTSDGILKVFEKARKYKEHNKSGDILPVVLLDEIGLAEVSQYNPLKVLHSLLEPGDGAFPDVAVVGISNWALDAAKMNRAIHLSRPEPNVDDLFDTGKSLRDAGSERTTFGVPRTRSGHPYRRDAYPDDKQLRCLAEAYHEYQGSQKYANFHGLRDYYSLIKCLSSNRNHNPSHHPLIEEKTQGIQHALQRNFGGVPSDVNNFQTLFQKRLHSLDLVEKTHHFKVTQLIRDNLHDKLARHLMIITNGDAAISILDQTLQSLDKEKITIFGSRFEEDLSEEYNYRMLSRIILCMERDCVLILRDLESIYGSLYDVLNQNYTVVGGKRNCRVALGALSNPMCQVHDGFRCIVLIDQRRVDFTDPPFLNRFEKQLLRFTDVLDGKQRSINSSLNEWVRSISTIPKFESQFHEEDMFVGFSGDTLPSLVLKNSQDEELGIDEILEKCKEDLMLIASPDGVLRSLESSLAKKNFEEVQTLCKTYFAMPLHNGLKEYLKHSLEALQLDDDATSGIRLLIMTHSNIHVNVAQCLSGLLQCQTEKLSAFKSEKHLTKQLERFWKSSDTLLVLQCKPELDATHMLLAKSIIEQQRQKYKKESMETAQSQIKHVCIIVHVLRESDANEVESQHWQFSFQSGWKQVTVDILEPPVLPITECLDASVTDLMDTKSLSFIEVASNEFLWCFTRIKYPAIRQPSVDEILKTEQLLRLHSSLKILECFKELVKRWLNNRLLDSFQHPRSRTWLFSVACDRQALIRYSHLVGAIQHYVSYLVRHPLAKIIYFLEAESAWPKFLYTQDPSDVEELQVWAELILNQEIFNIEDIPDHKGAESYFVPERHLQLKFPLAAVFCDRVDQLQPLFAEDQRQLLLNEANLDENGELHDVAAESQLHRFSAMIREKIPHVVELEYLQQNIGDYVEDLIDMKTLHFSDVFSREERTEFLKSAMANDIKFRIDGDPARLITRLHSLFWLNETSYTAALQVYATCSKIKHVDLKKWFYKLSTLFEEMLFKSEDQSQREEIDDARCISNYEKIEEIEVSCSVQNEQQNAESELGIGEGFSTPTLLENPTVSKQLERSNEKTSGEQEKFELGNDKFQEVKGGQSGSLEEQKELVENVGVKSVDEPDRQEDETLAAEEHLPSPNGSIKGQYFVELYCRQRVDNGENSGDMDEISRVQEPYGTAEVAEHQHSVETTSVNDDKNEEALTRVDEDIFCELDRVEKVITIEDKHVGKQEQTSEGEDGEEAEEKIGQENVLEHEDKGEGIPVNIKKNEELSEEDHEFRGEDDKKVVDDPEEESDVENEHTEEEISDNGAADETRIGFDEILVETLCSALFPTSDVIESFEGPDNWQRTTSLFLSTVSRLQVESPAFHFLRVCYDFVTLLVLPESLEPYSLYMLGSLGVMGNSEGYLDSQDVLDRIVNVVDEVAKRGVQQERLEDFLMLYYGRCIDSNPDTPVLGSILARICRSGQKSLIQLAGPLVHRVFLVEEEFSPGVFEKLLDHPETIGDHPGLQKIGYALSTLPGDVELDSPFAVVCCDLINEVAFLDIDFSTVSGSEDRLLLNFRKACKIAMEPTEDVEASATEDEDVEQRAFHLLCAVAYLKAFLTSFCAFILENSSHLVEDGEFSMLINEINAAFTSNGADQLRDTRILELQVYFLKELKKNLPMYQIYTLCQTSCKLPVMKMIQWQDDNLVTKLSFDPFQSISETSEVQAALATFLEKKNMKPFEDIIASMSQSVKIRVEAATVLAKSFFLVRSRRALKDSEDKAIASAIERIKKVETPYVNLLQRITGKKDFNALRLCVSPESLPEDVHKSTLILHLCIILASSFTSTKKGTPAMMSYFVDPMASVNSYVLASGEGGSQPYKKHWNYDVTRQLKTTSSSCSCGTFYVVVGDGKKASCPNCRSNFENEKKGIPNKASAQEGMLASKGYVSLLNSDDISLCVRQLKPAEFRILHLFVHAALYGGFALELFDNSSLSRFLNTKPKEGSPSEICFQQISNDLKVLCSILNAKEEEVLRFLHCALQECSSILTSAIFCSSTDERLSWEKKFASSIGPLLREFHPRKLLKRSVDASSSATQRKIEETDNPQFSEMNERNLHIPRLLRVTLPKTFNALKSYYMLTEDKERDKFPLLGLFLDFDDRLPLVGNLVHLVSWSRIVDSLLSRRLSRKDINKKIGDVIREKAKSQAEREQLIEAFENFTAAFEEMRPRLKEELQKEVPYVSESSPISVCLVEKRDQGVFLCVAIEVLQKIQNDFMQKVLSIGATGKSSALIFLERDKGKCSIPMVHVQEAREKEIIQYQWSDAILWNSQRNTEYGHGKEVFYDLAKIEKEMAARFLVGKAFLSTFDGLREFIFSRELFHTCRGILDELQKLIPQQPLTEILRSGLVRQSEDSLESVQELLEHMEIVLCLLKRHQHGKPEEPLTEFTDKWLGGSRPFPKQLLPQPHSAIQLMHVVALYEFLEDTLAESTAKRVHDTYRATIPKEITDDLAKAAFFSGKSETNRSTLRAITIALRRFIFRYLSSEEMRPEPGEGLAERMRESSLWPMDLNKSGKSLGVESLENVLHLAFPESLTIGQTYQILCFYQDRLKVSNSVFYNFSFLLTFCHFLTKIITAFIVQ